MRVRFYLEAPHVGKRKPFKFVNVLTTLPQFVPEVSDFWEETEPLFMSTSVLFRLSKKLKAVKPVLRALSKEKLGDLSKRTKEAYEKWQHLSMLEEGYLKQKSKLHWLAVGDRNNSYFHNSVKVRRMQNSIREITTSTGEILTNGEDKKKKKRGVFKKNS